MYGPMQDLLNLLQSTKLMDRKKAIEELLSWNNQLDMEDTITLLEEAGHILPISDEEWDDPSQALVRAACVFIHEEMIPVFEKNIFKYSYDAINFVCSTLLIFHSDKAIQLYENIFQQVYFQVPLIPPEAERLLILDKKESTITAISVLIENNLTLHPWYETYYHYLVSMAFRLDYLQSKDVLLDKELIKEKLQSLLDSYQQYHQDYKRTYVYEAWKAPYLELRFHLRNYLTVYGELCSVDELWSFKNILNFKDNYIRLEYIETLWKKSFSHELVDEKILEILVSDDGTHKAYKILEQYKSELIPKEPALQTVLVKEAAENLFYNSNLGNGKFPTDVEVMGSFQVTDTMYGGDLTYYVVRYKSMNTNLSDNGWMRMLMGAYYTTSIPTPWHPSELNNSYTDFVLWESKSYEGHVDDFRAYLEGKSIKYEKDEVFYESRPTYKHRNNTIALIFFVIFFGLIWVSDWFILLLPTPIVWLILKYLHTKKLERNILIRVRGHFFDYFNFADCTYVELKDISKIDYEKRTVARKERFLSIPLKKWHYILYDYADKEIYAIPANYLEEAYFISIIQLRTSHLTEPPVLTWEVEE